MPKSYKTDAQQCIILFSDLESYHKFVSQPDVQQHIWTYLDAVYDAITVTFAGGKAYWDRPPKYYEPLFMPQTSCWMADGTMYVWRQDVLSELDLIELCNRLVVLGQRFHKVRQYCQDMIAPGIWLPKRIRFGMSAGTGFIRVPDNARAEYMHVKEIVLTGYSAGVASRLVDYCKGGGPSAIFSARLPIRAKTLDKHRYQCAMAAIRKGAEEKVFMDKAEYEAMDPEVRNRLFRPV